MSTPCVKKSTTSDLLFLIAVCQNRWGISFETVHAVCLKVVKKYLSSGKKVARQSSAEFKDHCFA